MIFQTIRQIIDANQRKYDKHITFIHKQLEEMCVLPATDVWVYPDYPEGWHAVVGGRDYRDDKVTDGFYIFTVTAGNVDVEIQPCWGFRPNGSMIIK